MRRALLVTVRFHDERYHGREDWPPAPARLFQALVMGSARGNHIPEEQRTALFWLESLRPPTIAVPRSREGARYINYVPNNDLDAVGGTMNRIAEIRSGKIIHPRLFKGESEFLYSWSFASDDNADRQAAVLCNIADQLYQLGRGVDMAWAFTEILEEDAVEDRLSQYDGIIYRSTPGEGAKKELLCPQPGSLESLEACYKANLSRFRQTKDAKQMLFSQPPKPSFAATAYNSPPRFILFDLRCDQEDLPFAAWPLGECASLVENIRDKAAGRLCVALPKKRELIEQILIGRNATPADPTIRVRVIPLSSIGHEHADQRIRRILIEVPPGCPLAAIDIAWGFSGINVLEKIILIPSGDNGMLAHYGLKTVGHKEQQWKRWHTITPAALPMSASRRRIDLARVCDSNEQKDANERKREEWAACAAFCQSLRHAKVLAHVEEISVQREPFTRDGKRAEEFAPGTRFCRERLWHVQVAFREGIEGPLVIGDGRYLGLGLMAPVVPFTKHA